VLDTVQNHQTTKDEQLQFWKHLSSQTVTEQEKRFRTRELAGSDNLTLPVVISKREAEVWQGSVGRMRMWSRGLDSSIGHHPWQPNSGNHALYLRTYLLVPYE
jgi:hypothetical protein